MRKTHEILFSMHLWFSQMRPFQLHHVHHITTSKSKGACTSDAKYGGWGEPADVSMSETLQHGWLVLHIGQCKSI